MNGRGGKDMVRIHNDQLHYGKSWIFAAYLLWDYDFNIESTGGGSSSGISSSNRRWDGSSGIP